MDRNAYTIGFVFSKGMIEDNGYISKYDLSSCCREIFKYKVDIQIEEIDDGNINQIYSKLEKLGVNLIIALGDDASVYLYNYTKERVACLPWISLLSSSNFEEFHDNSSVIPKFWFSQDYEMSILANFIFAKLNDALLKNPLKCNVVRIGDSYYSNSLTGKFKDFFEKRYGVIVETNENFDVAFVAGLGDNEHISKIQSLLEKGDECRYILTNAAVQDKKIIVNTELKERCVYCVDVKRSNDKKLQLSILRLAFEIINDLLKDGESNIIQRILKTRCFISREFDESIGFSHDGYLTLPLVVKEVPLIGKDSSTVSKELYSISINEEKNNYDIAKFISSMNENIVLIGNNKEQTVFYTKASLLTRNKFTIKVVDIIKSYFNAVSVYISLTNNGIRYLSDISYTVDDELVQHIFEASIYSLRNRSLKPIQINLWEEDAPDNEVHRMCFECNNFLILPLGALRNITAFNNYDVYLTNNQYEKKEAIRLATDSTKIKRFLNIQRRQKHDAKYLYIIPCGISNEKTNSHVVVKTRCKLRFIDIQLLQITTNQLLPIYHNLISKKELLEESIKSAISAIMARNMSHNLGSHFISNTKHYFSNLAEIDENEQRQKDYRGIRHTLQYIQERMDFIATIVSTDRFPYGPVNVKSQIFDELTPDEFGGRHNKATTNFLLDYIVFSEDISKQSNLSSSSIKLSLKLISDNGIKFGGQNNQENQKAKEEFAKLNLAVPGGILGRHAIFTIIENVIRNSAKHDKESIPEDGLTVSIKIYKDHLVIFDNKKNANKKISGVVLKKELNERYAEIKILSDGAIDKSNKGLKEILISALWLNNYSLADWFGEYESIPKEDKIEKLSEVLRVVAVDDNGDMTDDGENLGYYIALDKYKEFYYIKDDMVVDDKINYSSISRIKADIIVANKDYEVFIDGNARQNEDVDINPNDVLKLSNIYPRFYENRDGGELPQVGEMMKAIIERNTGIMVKELNDINIHIEPKGEVRHSDVPNLNHCIWYAKSDAAGIKKNDILYKRHLSTLKTEEMDRLLAAYSDAAYIDSISGGDFTGTITQPFFLQDEFNRLKVIESALTEFVIIDERIFKNYGHGFKKINASSEFGTNKLLLDADKIFNEVEELFASGKSCEEIGDDISAHYHIELHALTLMENDKVLIRKDIDKKVAQKNSESASKTERMESNSDSFIALHKMIERRKLHIYDIDKNGNVMNLEGKTVANVTDRNEMKKLCSPTFLSIHLSIIEKITKENNNMKASEVMNNLKTIFGDTKYVTIHSGRGNLSAELEKELKDYAFLSLSAIQAAMDDSKYFLSQLLYNNCYIGKGRLNHK